MKKFYIVPLAITQSLYTDCVLLDVSSNLNLPDRGNSEDSNITEADTRCMSIWDNWMYE